MQCCACILRALAVTRTYSLNLFDIIHSGQSVWYTENNDDDNNEDNDGYNDDMHVWDSIRFMLNVLDNWHETILFMSNCQPLCFLWEDENKNLYIVLRLGPFYFVYKLLI